MDKARDPFVELRALVHRCALERRTALQAVAGDAETTMRLLGLILEIHDDAVHRLSYVPGSDRLNTLSLEREPHGSEIGEDDLVDDDGQEESGGDRDGEPGQPFDENFLDRLEKNARDDEEIWKRGIAEEGDHLGLAHYRKLKYARALEAGPQPGDTLHEPPTEPGKLQHLTRDELVRVHELAKQCVGRYHESIFALFIADALPRFKDAASKGHRSVPLDPQAWEQAAISAGASAGASETLLAATKMFVRVKEQGTYGGEHFPAEWQLNQGAFPFDPEAHSKPLYLRTIKDPERKWRSFLEAADGGNGRAVE